MMELFRLEHKKLWRMPSVRLSVLLCFGNNFDGYTVIRESQAYAEGFGGG